MAALFTSITTVVTSFLSIMTSAITWMVGQDLVLLFLGILVLGLSFKYVRSIVSGL